MIKGERKNQIIKRFNEAYNKVNVIRIYINILNIYEEKIKIVIQQ